MPLFFTRNIFVISAKLFMPTNQQLFDREENSSCELNLNQHDNIDLPECQGTVQTVEQCSLALVEIGNL